MANSCSMTLGQTLQQLKRYPALHTRSIKLSAFILARYGNAWLLVGDGPCAGWLVFQHTKTALDDKAQQLKCHPVLHTSSNFSCNIVCMLLQYAMADV